MRTHSKIVSKIVGVLLSTTLGVGCASVRTADNGVAQGSGGGAPTAPTLAAALTQAGYIGVPMSIRGGSRFVQATVGATPVDLLLDTGAPCDLLLDPSLRLGSSVGVHMTTVLSGYWASEASKGHWAIVDRLGVGPMTLQMLEAKVEPSPVSGASALLGATALMSRGAVIDYAADRLYLLNAPAYSAASTTPDTAPAQPTLRVALERARQYQTFLALMRQAGLMSLLETPLSPDKASDSVAWLGLRIQAEQLSGVGAMPPNDIHLHLTRMELNDELRRENRRTLFVPTDAAFARLPAKTLRALRSDTARLARLLRAHVFPGIAIDTADIRTYVRGAAQPTSDHPAFGFHVLGARTDVDRLTSWEDGRVVARATIVHPDLRAVNGVAHGIDRVLTPPATPSPLAAALARDGYVAVPLRRREDGEGYSVQATVNGVPARLTVATGTAVPLTLDERWGARLPSSTDGQYAVALGSVQFGRVPLTTADFGGRMEWARRQGYEPDVGVLGPALLVRYHAVVDCAAGMLYMRIPTTH